RDQQPRAVELWTALISLAERQGDAEQALRLLDEAERRLGPGVELNAARARHWSRRRGAEARKTIAGLERELDKYAGADQDRLLRELGDAYYLMGDAAGAERLWSRLAAQRPDQLSIRLLLFDLALQTGNEAVLQRILGEVRGIEGD